MLNIPKPIYDLHPHCETDAVPVEAEPRPTRAEAEDAVRTLIRWAGDEPGREGLQMTPARVVRAYEEWFAGYDENPGDILSRTFDEVGGYNDMVLLRDIPINSVCEHHMAPIHGVAHIAYLPANRVVGISKLARLADAFSRRLQVQERLTAEIANELDRILQPLGVAVVVEAHHECMSTRGVKKHASKLVTRSFRGVYDSAEARSQMQALLGTPGMQN